MTKISAIATVGRNNVIGRDNQLVWHIAEDLKRFKKITMGHPIIMGRKTFESIGNPLPGRTNIIITRDQHFKVKDSIVVHSIDEAIEQGRKLDNDEIFIIGGSEIYNQALSETDRLYLTLIDDEKDGDVFFPDYSKFSKEVFREEHEHEGLKYTWVNLER